MSSPLDDADVRLKLIISNLYHLMVQTHEYEGNQTHQKMTSEAKSLIKSMLELRKAGSRLTIMIPMDLIDFVENARNPDIYTRQFVEEAMRLNQELKGKAEAFGEFRNILGREMMSAIPDIREEVRKIVLSSNGSVEA